MLIILIENGIIEHSAAARRFGVTGATPLMVMMMLPVMLMMTIMMTMTVVMMIIRAMRIARMMQMVQQMSGGWQQSARRAAARRDGAQRTTVRRRRHQIIGVARTRMLADRRGGLVATRQQRELLVRIAERLQPLQDALVRHVAQVQETRHGRAERLQLGEFVLRVGELRAHARLVIAQRLVFRLKEMRQLVFRLHCLHCKTHRSISLVATDCQLLSTC